MCGKDILFCTFYFLGFVSIVSAFFAGVYIILDWLREKRANDRGG